MLKKTSIIGLTLLMALAGCGGQNDRADQAIEMSDRIFPYAIHHEELPNKLSVVTVEYPSPDLAAFYIIVRAGSREEVEEGKTGFAHFFEHMMFRGTEKYPPEKYRQALMSIGAAANANTWFDRTVYHMTGSAEMLESMFELEADRFMRLSYSEHDFKTEAGAVKGEYTKNYSNPYRKLHEKTVEAAFQEHTYKHTTMGFWEDIVDMPNQYDYSLLFFDRFYRPEYTTILVVGDVEPDQVNELAREYFGKWETGSYQPEIPEEPGQRETKYAHVQVENFPPYLSLNYKAPAFNDDMKDVAALDIIAAMLFSERSDLYKKLVIEDAILRDLQSTLYFTRDPYLFSVSASFKQAADMQGAKDQITAELNRLKTEPVDTTLLEETISHLKYSLAMEMDNPTDIAETLSYFIWVSGDPQSMNRYLALYDEITQEDIMQAANEYFVPEKLTISTISPNEEGGIQ